MAGIFFKHVGKTYKDSQEKIEALRSISFDIKEKEFVSIIGPNGSGKTTLFMLLLGLIKPDSGRVVITPKNSSLGFVFQNYRDSLMPWATVIDNVLLPLEESKISKKKKLKLGQRALLEIGLDKFQDFHIYQISGGMSQLVALARALIINPEILLLDEPFSALDYQRSIKMQEMLANIWQKKKMTTLMISHDIDEAIYLSSKIVILSKRPGTVKDVVGNNLPWPRNFRTRISTQFQQLRSKILKQIEMDENTL